MNNSLPLVSIVIPVYNRQNLIEKALSTAVNQSYQNIEIIIVDNKSTDNTWQILKDWKEKDERIKIFQNEKNLGPVLNWQKCFEKASGEFVKILWSDDWIDLDFVEKAIDLMDDNTAFVISSIIVTDTKDILSKFDYCKDQYLTQEYLDDILLYDKIRFPVSPGCAFFRKNDILQAFVLNIPNSDGLNSMLNGAGNDLLIFLNIAMKYDCIRVLNNSYSYFRAHRDSFTMSNNLILYYEWAKVYFIKSHKLKRLEMIYKFRYLISKVKGKKEYLSMYEYLDFKIKYLFSLIPYLIKRSI